jgi:hypothetical protein
MNRSGKPPRYRRARRQAFEQHLTAPFVDAGL